MVTEKKGDNYINCYIINLYSYGILKICEKTFQWTKQGNNSKALYEKITSLLNLKHRIKIFVKYTKHFLYPIILHESVHVINII